MKEYISPIEKLKRELKEEKTMRCENLIDNLITDAEILDISKTSRSNYFCVFSRIPNLIYYVQSFSLPSASNRKIQISMPHTADYYVAGHKTDYEEFTMNFYMDEKYHSYFSLLKWMRENEKRPNIVDTTGVMSLIILNISKIPIIRVDFTEVLCSSIGDIQFENQSPDTVVFYGTFTSYKYHVKYLDGSNIVIE